MNEQNWPPSWAIPQTNVPASLGLSIGDIVNIDASEFATAYNAADPYPHIVIDNIFPPEVLRTVVREIGTIEVDAEKQRYASVKKHRISDIWRMPPATRRLIEDLNSAPFVSLLEQITGIKGLLPDPHLEGGGVHQIGPGGYLKVHTDFNWHRRLQAHRRINLLLYLNEGWQEEWGGHLELWSEGMEACRARIAPLFNRMAIFSTTDASYHGHPDRLACPEDVRRNSIALYYYSTDRPSGETKFGRSEMTNYRERPGEEFESGKLMHAFEQARVRLPLLRKLVDNLRR